MEMSLSDVTSLATFLMVSSLTLLVTAVLGGRKSRLDARLGDLSGAGVPIPDRDAIEQLARAALPKIGAQLIPEDEEERKLLQARLMHAGLYSRQAMVLYLGIKILMMTAPALLGMAAGLTGVVQMAHGVLVGSIAGAVGTIGPSFWLDRQKATRQIALRRGLPDALDVVVICLEGGLSLPGTLRYVVDDLRAAHSLLAAELNIAQREIQLGLTAGEALRKLAIRSDMEEIHSLASVIIQADRLGASLVKSLRVHADTLRLKRRQRAEEMAQKAATKILFPTIIFIFPSLFVVILAPGLIQLTENFRILL